FFCPALSCSQVLSKQRAKLTAIRHALAYSPSRSNLGRSANAASTVLLSSSIRNTSYRRRKSSKSHVLISGGASRIITLRASRSRPTSAKVRIANRHAYVVEDER